MQESARLLAEAMFIREKYISLRLQEHCPTTAKALNEIDEEFDVNVLLNGRELSVERKNGRSEIISRRSNRNNLEGIGWGLFLVLANICVVLIAAEPSRKQPGIVFSTYKHPNRGKYLVN